MGDATGPTSAHDMPSSSPPFEEPPLSDTDVAIIGTACRLPGSVHSPSDLWTMLLSKLDGYTPMSEINRFSTDGFYHPNPSKRGAFNAKGAHFLTEDISLFDAGFFNITANEAAAMDPQHRLLLEVAYEAIESAGLTVEQLRNKKWGVFAGASYPDYSVHLLRDTETCPMYHGTGTAEALLSNRISYFLDLRGPSMTIETACSSALSAMHTAITSIKAGDCPEGAIVGACHLNVVPDTFVSLSKSQLLSPEGRSYAFDERATSGYGRGEGSVAIVLKPLGLARRDGDPIRAVVRGSGINQDGRTKGITYPNGQAQEELMRDVYKRAGLDPKRTSYVEAHGTGTAVGDPIETEAISQVFGPRAEEALFVGSLKSQAGHLEGACGVASVIKTVEMLERCTIPPQGNFDKLNPKLPFDKWGMRVAKESYPWKTKNKVRRASVNNFGFGGTNAHVILEQVPEVEILTDGHANGLSNGHSNGDLAELGGLSSRVVVLSAKDEGSLNTQADRLLKYLSDTNVKGNPNLGESLAYTLASRRTHYPWRIATPAPSVEQLSKALRDERPEAIRTIREPKICFVFTGQGAQWLGMGKELMHAYPVFGNAMRQADACLKNLGASWSLLEELSTEPSKSRLGEAVISQPACSAIQVALTLLLKSWGVEPQAVVGHSSGEIAAAFAAGAVSLEDAMLLAYQRGVASMNLGTEHPELHGSMLAVGASQKEAQTLVQEVEDDLDDEVEAVVACVNSPSSVTISGDSAAITEIAARAADKGLFNRALKVDMAYHSRHMEMVAEKYHATIAHLQLESQSKVRFFSALAGHEVSSSMLDTAYWTNNLTAPVQFEQALEALQKAMAVEESAEPQKTVLIEIGPHSALEGPVKQTLKGLGSQAASTEYVATLIRNKDAVLQLQQTASSIFMHGHRIELEAVNQVSKGAMKPKVLTDLPSYAWKHTEKYWYESRVSRNHRLRQFRRHDLLGSLTTDYNDLEPTWRNVLDIEQTPWLRDHRVQSNSVFPLAGYLVMAIEAAHQKAILKDFEFSKYPNAEYVLRDVIAARALVIGEDVEVEMMTTFKPYRQSSKETSDVWDEFRVASWEADKGWTEHCRGQISLQKNDQANPLQRKDSEHTAEQRFLEEAATLRAECQTRVNWDNFLQTFSKGGIEYGPTFRGLIGVDAGVKSAISIVRAPDTQKTMPNGYESEYIIHPVVLDACCQASFPAFTDGKEDLEQAFVPTFIKRLAVSHGFGGEAGIDFTSYFRTTPTTNEICASGFVTRTSQEKPTMQIDELKLVLLSNNEAELKETRQDELCANVVWRPSIDLLTTKQFVDLLGQDKITEEEKLSFDVLEQAAFFYTERAIADIKQEEVETFQTCHQKMHRWLKSEYETAVQGDGLRMQTPEWTSLDEATKDRFLMEVRQLGPAGELLCKMGEALPAICRQEIDPLSIMFENELLSRWYRSNASLNCGYARNQRFVDLLGHQNPYLNIIEIGGGTAGTTVPTLEMLGGCDGKMARFVNYTFTDISTGFFENARKKLEPWGGLVSYAKLDIEKDPEDQGFKPETYDLVIAANVLHATSNMDRTLKHVRKLLKPGGKLALLEVTMTQLQHLIFATLPGWWLAEGPGREKGPVMDEEEWSTRLLRAGFSGIDCSLQDFPGEKEQNGSMMYSTAISDVPDDVQEVVIVCDNIPPGIDMDGLKKEVQILTRKKPVVASVAEADLQNKTCIFLEELNGPVLRRLGPETFGRMQSIFSTAHSVLWVVKDANLACGDPDTSMAIGLARTVRSETGMRIVTLDLGKMIQKAQTDATEAILRVFKTTFVHTTSSSLQTEMEFAEKDSMVQIPRLVLAKQLNRTIDREMFGGSVERQPLKQKGRPLRLTVETAGQLDSLYFEDNKERTETLMDEDVEIEVSAVGLNFKDVLIALGQVPWEPLGGELSGKISAKGSKVSGLEIGDRVCAAPSGSFATHVRCPAASVARVPGSMSDADAASLPIAFVTAYYSLMDVARLSKDESVLIHAAAGGVGQAAIQIAQTAGATIFATVGSDEKKNHLISEYGVPASNIFYSRDTSFAGKIMRCTAGKGVDVILNSLSGEALHASWSCLAAYGRFVEIGKKDLQNNAQLAMSKFARNCTFTAVDLGAIRADRPEMFNKIFQKVIDLSHKGKIHAPTPVNLYSFSELEPAFRLMQSGKHTGKIVLQVREDDEVMVSRIYAPRQTLLLVPRKNPSIRRSGSSANRLLEQAMPQKTGTTGLRSDASYLLSGGSGGLGRSLSKWLVAHGAKNIILASRSGLKNEKAKALVAEIAKLGAKLEVRQCDVSDREEVQNLVADCKRFMPRIRGVIHGAMVLKVSARPLVMVTRH